MKLDRRHFICGLAGGGGLWASGVGASGARPNGSALPDPALAGEDFWEAVGLLFDFAPGLIYLNTGGLGPAAAPVRRAEAETAARLHRAVDSGHGLFEEVRTQAAAFVGAQADEVAFVRNATEGNSIVAGGLALEPGDEVIMESHAHPGGSFPWLLQAERRGVVVRVFEPAPDRPEGNWERIAAAAGPRTRVLQVSHVTAPTGLRFPVAELAAKAREWGWWFHVDGAQSLGMFPFDLRALGVDSYAASGHKWLGAPRETGLLYVRRERAAEVRPLLAGAYSGEVEGGRLPGRLNWRAGVPAHEYGTRDAAAVAGVGAALELQETLGRDRLAARALALAERLREGLGGLPDVEILSPTAPALRSPMVTFRSPRLGFNEIFHALWQKHGLRCRPVSEEGLDAVRVSLHLFNRPTEVDRLVAALDGLLARA